MPDNLVESQKLEKPLFTPSTKADQGEHDENIHPDKGKPLHYTSYWTDIGGLLVKDICGAELAAEIEKVALRIYSELSCPVTKYQLSPPLQPKQRNML